jgi:hypothetical protein
MARPAIAFSSVDLSQGAGQGLLASETKNLRMDDYLVSLFVA